MDLDPKSTAVVAIDMHRGHLDPGVATLPIPADLAEAVVARSKALFDALRSRGVPIVHVVVAYRDASELLSNPFWAAIHDRTDKKRSGVSRHNIIGGPGPEVMPDLIRDGDILIDTKKRYSCFHATELDFVLSRKLKVDTLILAGINTSSCVLNASFEATNRDYRAIIASDACETMDGREMHDFALRLMANVTGWPMTNDEILAALG
jgi:Amidases related to nicotinamidase